MEHPSPAVERAVAAAEAWAGRLGGAPRLADLLLGLLDEDEGRPAVLVERLGLRTAALRDTLVTPAVRELAPVVDLERLYHAARRWSVAHRADPLFLTDALLVAAVRVDPGFAAAAGLDAARLDAVASGRTPDQPPDDPAALAFAEPADHRSGDRWHLGGDHKPPEPVPADSGMDAARVLDANFNRAREAARVVEDYCRFVLDDQFLTTEAKSLRHDLAAASAGLPARFLLAARDTLGDVGTAVTAAGEYDRASAVHVVQANLKRFQEAARCLEEFGKLIDAALGRRLEAARYRSYTLERAVVLGTTARERLRDVRLYVLLTQSQAKMPLTEVVARAAAGGADVFQLREKDLGGRDLLARARELREATQTAGVLFIVNDRPDVARLAGADGVHLGQDDVPVREARRVVGPDALIGVSTHTVEQLRRAILDGADYVGIGPTFPSTTKAFDTFAGLDFVRAAAAETSLPAFALGGIGPATVKEVVAAGGRRIAVSAAVTGGGDPERAARVLRAALGG